MKTGIYLVSAASWLCWLQYVPFIAIFKFGIDKALHTKVIQSDSGEFLQNMSRNKYDNRIAIYLSPVLSFDRWNHVKLQFFFTKARNYNFEWFSSLYTLLVPSKLCPATVEIQQKINCPCRLSISMFLQNISPIGLFITMLGLTERFFE